MRLQVVLLNNYFLALAFTLGVLEEATSCDTKWLRFMYMKACGRKKRQSNDFYPDFIFEQVPTDYDEAVTYFTTVKRHNSNYPPDIRFLAFLEKFQESNFPNQFLNSSEKRLTRKSSSVLLEKVLLEDFQESFSGAHNERETMENEEWEPSYQLENRMVRKEHSEVDKLVEKCCTIPQVRTCNVSDFLNLGCK